MLAHAACSIGVEIVDDVGVPDVVLVCCGGGGLLSGVSAATRLSLPDDSRCRIYGVEPRGGKTAILSSSKLIS